MFDCKSCCNADESKEVIVGIPGTAVPGMKFDPPMDDAAKKAEQANAEKKAREEEEAAAAKAKEAAAKAEAEKKAEAEAAAKAKKETEAKAAAAAEKAAAEKKAAEEAAAAKAAKEDAAKPKRLEFEISVSKDSGEQLGLDVDFQDASKLQVEKVKPGLVQTWNDKNPAQQVKAKDSIIRVNSATNTQAMIQEVKNAKTLNMHIRRENEVVVNMTKSDPNAPIGLDIDSATLSIVKVKEGAVMDFNSKLGASMKEFAIKPGDKFVAVNGKTTINGMVEQLKSSKELKVIVQRL